MSAENKMKRLGLRIDPLDVFFFRDGRPFEPASRAKSELPKPQTLLGALRTAIIKKGGGGFERLAEEVKKKGDLGSAFEAIGFKWLNDITLFGPWIAKFNDGNSLEDIFVPVPAILRESKDRAEYIENKDTKEISIFRLLPLRDNLPGWKPPENGMRPLWLKKLEQTEKLSGFLNLKGLEEFLNNKLPSKIIKGPNTSKQNEKCKKARVLDNEDLFDMDHRIGIGIDPDTLTTQEGIIYAASFLVLKDEYSFYAEVEVPENEASIFDEMDTISFGGEKRKAQLSTLKPFAWPRATDANEKEKPLLLMITPGIFPYPYWRPQKLERKLVSARVPGYLPVSGWDLARGGPKPNRFAVCAGSVYFLNEPFNSPTYPASLCEDEYAKQGWGIYLEGRWKDE